MTKLAFLLLLLLFARNGEMNPCGGVSADPSTWSHVDMELRSWLDVRGYSAAAPALEARDGGLYVRDGHRLLPGDEIAVIPRSLILTSNDVFGTGASKIPDHVRWSFVGRTGCSCLSMNDNCLFDRWLYKCGYASSATIPTPRGGLISVLSQAPLTCRSSGPCVNSTGSRSCSDAAYLGLVCARCTEVQSVPLPTGI